MSFIGRLLGTEAATAAMVDGVTKGLDALVYTDEEKAGDAAKDRAEARAMLVRWMEATQGQNLSRRLLALMISAVWLSQYVLSLVGDMAIPWISDPAIVKAVQESNAAIGDRAESMNGAMMLILAFYFAAPHMGDIAKAAIGKFGKGGG